MKKFAFLLFLPVLAFGQNPDIKRTYHWYFGTNAGLNFYNTSSPSVETGNAMTAFEGTAAISDTCGNVLFYTNGDTVWNKNHQIMPNGTGLLGSSVLSSTQAALIIPQPLNDSIYFIFTTDDAGNLGANGLRYSIVNMNLSSGLGDVTTKNILLFSPTTEKLTATFHNNGIDIWVLGRKLFSQDFYAYLVTSTGVQSPIVTTIGASANAIGDGYMRFSYDGNKIASAYHTGNSAAYDTVDVYDFDKSTGVISNQISLTFGIPGEVYGVCFSPDNSKLYVTFYTSSPYSSNIYQFDLSSGIPATIQTSKTLIDSDNTFYGSLQKRPDNKLFVTQISYSVPVIDSLGTINNPNAAGIGCSFVKNDFSLQGSYPQIFGLPNFIESYLNGNWMPACPSAINEEKNNPEFSVYPNPCTEFIVIDFQNLLQQNIELKIYDMLGKEIQKTTICKGTKKFILKMDRLSIGIYLLTLKFFDKIVSKKIMFNP